MRVAFVQDILEELQGTLLLAEILEREGHRVRFVLSGRGWLDDLDAWAPEAVCASAVTGDHRSLLGMLSLVKQRVMSRPVTILGGPHATFHPQVVRHPAVDAVCVGEGERALVTLLAGLRGGELPVDVAGTWVKSDGGVVANDLGGLVEDLDSLPIPRRALYDGRPFFSRSPVKRMMTSRGCPFGCAHCHNPVYREMVKGKGRYLRRRSVEHVIEEALYLDRTFGFEVMEFDDDVFTSDREWFLAFAREWEIRVGKPYFVLVHPTQVDDEIADALRSSGCVRVMFGVESGSERIRREVMNRPVRDDHIVRCAQLLDERALAFQTFNMLGLPGETLDDALATVRLNQRIRPAYAWCSIAQPYPGTALAERCLAEGLVDEADLERIRSSYFDDTVMDLGAGAQLANLQKMFSLLVSHPWLEPVALRLMRLPAGEPLRLVHQLDYGLHVARRNRLGIGRAARLYLAHRRHYGA